ncbi:MAG TPA: ATP-dependent DNA ligase [Thermoleophilia bacterium]
MADWPFEPPIVPMEAEVADELPPPPGWAYEPKWDGFRVVAWSGGGSRQPRLDSRNSKPLLRYFPELEPALAQLPPGTVTDGEVVVVVAGKLDFDALQNRIHPAESRVRLLARETPAHLALFDLLAVSGEDTRHLPFRERRKRLMELAHTLGALGADEATPYGGASDSVGTWMLSPSTTHVEVARRWFHDFEPAGFDGIVAKALDRPYAEGRREMIKLKHRRTVDTVIGGYRLHKDGRRVGSLLLGLYNEQGELHFIGHNSSFSAAEAAALLTALRPLEVGAEAEKAGGFGEHARRPGGQSRWSGEKELDFVAVRPELVIEISYDQLTGDRFRHATRFERWRPDKDPRDCTMDQLERPKGPALIEAIRRAGAASSAEAGAEV